MCGPQSPFTVSLCGRFFNLLVRVFRLCVDMWTLCCYLNVTVSPVTVGPGATNKLDQGLHEAFSLLQTHTHSTHCRWCICTFELQMKFTPRPSELLLLLLFKLPPPCSSASFSVTADHTLTHWPRSCSLLLKYSQLHWGDETTQGNSFLLSLHCGNHAGSCWISLLRLMSTSPYSTHLKHAAQCNKFYCQQQHKPTTDTKNRRNKKQRDMTQSVYRRHDRMSFTVNWICKNMPLTLKDSWSAPLWHVEKLIQVELVTQVICSTALGESCSLPPTAF